MKLNTYTAEVTFRVEAPTEAVARAIMKDILEDANATAAQSLIDIDLVILYQSDDHNEGGLEIGFTF